MAINNLDSWSRGTWEKPLLVSKTAKYLVPFNFSIMSSIVWEGVTYRPNNFLIKISQIKANSKRTIGFFTITNEFNHLGLMSLPSNFEMIPWSSMLSCSFLNCSHITTGTFLWGFCIGTPFCFVIICTGLHLNLQILLKRWAYFGWLTIDSDKVRVYEEIMMNDDNLEANLLTSILLKMLYKFLLQCWAGCLDELNRVVPISKWRSDWRVIAIYTTSVNRIDSIGYHSLHRSIMGCSLRVTRGGVAGWECEC